MDAAWWWTAGPSDDASAGPSSDDASAAGPSSSDVADGQDAGDATSRCGFRAAASSAGKWATSRLRIVTLGISGGRRSRGRFAKPTEGYTYAAKVWDLSIVQGPFAVAPCQTATLRFATFSSEL
jgi:hypothetical protein